MFFFIQFSKLFFQKNKKKNEKCRHSMSTNLDKFANFISGEWSNKAQAQEFPSLWSHIQVCFRPLKYEFLNGYSFYVESAYNYCLDQPYKSGVMFIEENGELIQTKNYAIIGPEDFWFGSYDPTLLKDLTFERLIPLSEGCNTIFNFDEVNEVFTGKTRIGKNCFIPKNGKKTYLDSTFILEEGKYQSVDIGRDIENDQQIWGSKDGPFCFKKKQYFPF